MIVSTWVLTVLILINPTTPAVQTVQGYSSYATCHAAAVQADAWYTTHYGAGTSKTACGEVN
jgi:hypothetical protein